MKLQGSGCQKNEISLTYFYMIKRTIILVSIISFFWGLSFKNTFAMNPKSKAVLTLAGYGAAGGALLGVAAMAFDAEARSVAIGASLGLYGGLLFGGYVVITHYLKKKGYFKKKPSYYGSNPSWQGGGQRRLKISPISVRDEMNGMRIKDFRDMRNFGPKRYNSIPLVINFVNFQF